MILTFLLIAASCKKDDNGESIVVPKSDAKAVTSFVLNTDDNGVLSENIIATVGEDSKNIVASVPSGTDVTMLSPKVQISEKASISPNGPQDFSSPIIYTVTAEDGTVATYEVTIIVSASDAKQLIGFVFSADANEGIPQDISGTINTANDIFLTVPSGTNVTGLTPAITTSFGASVAPQGEVDFSSPVIYTVTAADGSIKEYTVNVSLSITQKDALIAITNANPEFDLDWSLSEAIENWEGVTVDNGLVTELVLRNANIKILPKEIEVLIALRNLNLNSNELTAIPNELFGLQSLEILQMRNNGILELSENIGNLNKLLTLDITQNQLKKMPEEIGQLTSMTNFSFGNNSIEEIPASIGGLKSLVSISAEKNKLIRLPKEIGLLPELETIYVADNSINSIPESLGQLEQLSVLLMENNDLEELPATLNMLKNLQFLDLTNNPLSKLPLIDNLQNLQFLGLSNSKFTNIPEQVFALSNLVSLTIDNNLIKELPEKVFSLKKLESLNISNNMISTVSTEIKNLFALKRLDLSNNEINTLPKEITILENVSSLKIENNQIVGLSAVICEWINSITTVTIDDNVTCTE